MQVFSDPASGEVMGWRPSGSFSLDRTRLMDTLHGLHVDLLLGGPGAWLVGLVGLLWVLDHLVSAWLSFPRLAA